MKQLSLQGAILVAVAVVCASAISIALIGRADCNRQDWRSMRMMEGPPPVHEMRSESGRHSRRGHGGMMPSFRGGRGRHSDAPRNDVGIPPDEQAGQ